MSTINEQQRLMNIITASHPDMTELDKKIIQIAITNPPQFFALIGSDALLLAKTCLLRQEKKSYGAIAFRLDLPRKTVESMVKRNCEKCLPEGQDE